MRSKKIVILIIVVLVISGSAFSVVYVKDIHPLTTNSSSSGGGKNSTTTQQNSGLQILSLTSSQNPIEQITNAPDIPWKNNNLVIYYPPYINFMSIQNHLQASSCFYICRMVQT